MLLSAILGDQGDRILTLDKLHLQPIIHLINSQRHTLDGQFATSCLGNIRETKAEGEEEEMRTAMPPSASQGEKRGFLPVEEA